MKIRDYVISSESKTLKTFRWFIFIVVYSTVLLVVYTSHTFLKKYGMLPLFLITFLLVFLPVDLKTLLMVVWALVPFQLSLSVTSTTNVWPVEVMGFPLYAFLLIRFVIEKQRYEFTGFEKLLFCFLMTAFIGVLRSPVKYTSMGALLGILNGVLFFFMVSQFLNKEDVERFFYVFLLLGIMESIVLILQVTTGKFGFIPRIGRRGVVESLIKQELAEVRVPNGTFLHFNTAGSFIDVVYPFSLAFLYVSRRKVPFLVGFVIMLLGVISVHSRGTLMATLVSSTVFLTLITQNFFFRMAFPIIVGFLAVSSAGILWKMGYSAAIMPNLIGRLILWSVGLSVFRKHPIIGSGLGSSIYYTNLVVNAPYKYHNVYITLLAERGLVGFILWFLILWVYFKYMFYAYRKFKSKLNTYGSLYAISVGGICSFAGFLTHGMVDHAYTNVLFKIWFYGFLAFAYIVYRIAREKEEVKR